MNLSQMRDADAGRNRRPTRTLEICLAQDLVAEAEQLSGERMSLLVEVGRTPGADGEHVETPRKLGAPVLPPRVAEIDARLAALYDEMGERTGVLLLRGESPGAWRRWADENPARTDDHDEDGRPLFNVLDVDVARGHCNASALFGRLRDFAEAWNDEPISDDDWAYLVDNAANGDLKSACRLVVDMHEAGGSQAPKSRKPSSGTQAAAS